MNDDTDAVGATTDTNQAAAGQVNSYTLGQAISDLLAQKTAMLTAAANDPGKQDQIRAYLEDLVEQLPSLINKNYDQTNQLYQAAVASVSTATDALNSARKNLTTLDDALSDLSNAINGIASLIAAFP